MMMSNPEFRRNIWLEISSHRLIAMPLILAILLFFSYLINGSEFNQGLADSARVICMLMIVLWGAHLASEAVLSEVREHTWDNQRMSAMPAWHLMWGKLLGSTIYTWYGTFFCLLVYVYSSDAAMLTTLKLTVSIILCGLFAQALGMLFALMFIRKGDKIVRSQSMLFVLLAATMAWNLFSVTTYPTAALRWFDLSFDASNFWLSSTALFLAWAWVGNDRLMRAELQVSNRIWVWFIFVLFSMVYVAGFFDDMPWQAYAEAGFSIPLLTAFSTAAILMYLMLFSESKNLLIYKRLLALLKGQHWDALPSALQCWMGALILMIISGVVLMLQMMSESMNALFVLAFLLFALRDVCLVLYLNFNANRKRADMTAMLYLFVLYVVLPGIFASLDISTALFLPYDEHGNAWLSVIAALAQCVIAFGLMRHRWLRNDASKHSDSPSGLPH